jgi:WD40 repeat protein
VQHAHQKGIIHRDLKPSNVLVSRYDTTPVVKVIDFGVAKALGQELTDKTLFTGLAQMIGTPLYMSPEQAGMSDLDIDTRSDIYSLGVLLYELLTGTTPFTKERFQQASYDEIRRIIREEEPPRPSLRLSESEDRLTTVSARRQTEPAKLTKLVRGELDWIVMKCLEKDRTRRYETASALAQDLQRYLHDEPVTACPPSAWYRLGKFARRHKVGLTFAGLVTALLLLAVGILAVANVEIGSALSAKSQAYAELDQTLGALNQEQAKTRSALDQERLTLHGYRISLAHREWWANRVGRADFLLEECPEPLRGWEWHYLKRLCHAELRTLRGHFGYVHQAVFSPDGTRVATAGMDSTVGVWDTATGRMLHRVRTGDRTVDCVAYRSDGRQIASGGFDGIVRLWDPATGELLGALRGHTAAVSALAYSPDGRRLASVSLQDSLRLWDPGTGREIAKLSGRPPVNRLPAFSPDGRSLAWLDYQIVAICDSATGQERHRWRMPEPVENPQGLVFRADGKALLLFAADGTGRACDVATGAVVAPLDLRDPAGAGPIKAVALDPDGARLATAHEDQAIRVWDGRTARRLLTLRGHTDLVESVAFSRDGLRLVSASSDSTAKIWELTGPQESLLCRPSLLGGGRGANGHVAFSPDGRQLALVSHRGFVGVFDTSSGQEVGFFTYPKNLDFFPWSVAYCPDGRHVLVGSSQGAVRVLDARTGETTLRCRGDTKFVFAVAVSPDGRLLASASLDRIVKIWDATTGAEIRTLPHAYPVAWVAFSPDGRRLASCDYNGAKIGTSLLRLWDVTTGAVCWQRQPHSSQMTCVAFSADGSRLASASVDRTIKVWDVSTGAEVRTLASHASAVRGVAFHPTGRRLATATDDGSVLLWDLTTGRELLTLSGGTPLLTVAFSRDGHKLAAGGDDGTARIWDGTPRPAPTDRK